MLHIILLILKIIGVILLSVLGLLLALLLIVLLVPVRYQLRVSHGEALYLKGGVSWLLHLVQISVTHIEGVLHIRARILGFLLYDNLKPRKTKKKKAQRNLPKKDKQSAVKEKESTLAQKFMNNKDDTEKAEDNNLERTKIKKIKTEETKTKETRTEETGAEKIKTEETKIRYKVPEISDSKTGDSEAQKEVSDAKQDPFEQVHLEYGDDEASHSRKKESGFSKLYHKLRNIPRRWRAAYRKVRNKLQSIRESIRNKINKLKDIVTDIRHNWNLIYDFWMDELNKQGMKYTWQIIKKLLKHILPTKLKSELIIGTGDPYSTGQLLSIISFFYGFYKDKVSVVPDFENNRFEGKHYARGRIRAATVLFIACRLLIDKRFKYLKKNFLILKEAL
jgi:hypothetical protein